MIVGIVLNLILKDKPKFGVNGPATITFTNTKTGESFDIKEKPQRGLRAQLNVLDDAAILEEE